MNDDIAQSSVSRLPMYGELKNLRNNGIDLTDLSVPSPGGKMLVDETRLQLLPGRRYGLIGRQGSGKTTLMKCIAEHRLLGMFKHIRVLYIDDDAQSPLLKETVLEYLLAQHRERVDNLKSLHDLLSNDEVDIDLLEEVAAKLRHLDADTAEARARKLLVGIGLESVIEASMSTLSGGYRHKVALAAAVFVDVDVLLLDEPTNHLDLYAICWLESMLRNLPKTVTLVVVSHDYHFLNGFVTDMIQIEGKKLNAYRGDFDDFARSKAQLLQRHQRMFTAQETRRKRMEDTIAKLEAKSSRSRGNGLGAIRSRKRTLQIRLGASLDGKKWKYGMDGPRPEILAPLEEEPFVFELSTDVSDVPDADGELETVLISAKDLAVFAPGSSAATSSPLLENVNLDITLSTRYAIVGRNGTGKSTLLRTLLGEVPCQQGSLRIWEGIRVAYLAQDATKILESSTCTSALQWIKENARTELKEREARNLLGVVGLIGRVVEEIPVKSLSAGQRTLLQLALLLRDNPHLLVLDEPTSHLDAETSAALSFALQSFDGGVVVVSHDEGFVTEVASDIFVCSDSGLERLAVPFYVYRRSVEKQVSQQGSQQPVRAPTASAVAIKPSLEVVKAAAAAESKRKQEKEEQKRARTLDKLGNVAILCRKCGGGHFTHSCTAPAPEAPPVSEQPRRSDPPSREPASDGGPAWKLSVPKHLRPRK